MEKLNGGYVMLDLNAKGLYDKALALIGVSKPILLYPLNNGTPYYIVKISVVTESGSTYININDEYKIASDGTVTTIDGYTLLENIIDKDDHKRFIEGNITTTTQTGITYNYNRWSLSGTHLMIKLILKIEANASLLNYGILGDISIPEWVYNKCIPIGDEQSNWVSVKTVELLNNNGQPINASTQFLLNKVEDPNVLRIYHVGSTIEAAADTYIEVQFDLLIDNE